MSFRSPKPRALCSLFPVPKVPATDYVYPSSQLRIAMRREFIDFFNHGTLPSVGRERERERIVEFWRLPPSQGGTELRAMLLIGEAGVGKSHLIEGALRAIEEEGGATVHIKLRPEGSASLAPLIDEGL